MTLFRRGIVLAASLIPGLGSSFAQDSSVTPFTRPGDSLRIRPAYDTVAYPFRPVYSLPIVRDTASRVFSPIPPKGGTAGTGTSNPIFGTGFLKSGSISRGFQVGTNRDATVVAGFRLQVAGPLTEDVQLNAALTDENSPIQPEGTTQSLREVDRVSIDVTGRSFGVTLGDLVFERSGTEAGSFGSVLRKLQGISGYARTSQTGMDSWNASVSAVAAGARGVYHSQSFQGRDGVQGPYRLTGKNGERYIVVIAGSEDVRINGERMKRGEIEDYTVDYATGEIVFTSKRLVTSDSRIVADFEYADRQYARSMVGAEVQGGRKDGLLSARVSILQEADDPDNPLGGPLDENTRSILAASGSDRLLASVSGIRQAETDSVTGRPMGQYALVDTVIDGTIHSILVFAPGSSSALYNVTFSPVSQVPSDSAGYERAAGFEFRFAGVGRGSYVPRVFLPLPRLQRNVVASLTSAPFDGLVVGFEAAGSRIDQNRISGVDGSGSIGSAYEARAAFTEKDLRIFGRSFGSLDIHASKRSVDSRFLPFGRIRPAEYNRDWDVPIGVGQDEQTEEVSASYIPTRGVRVGASRSAQERSGGFSADRTSMSGTVADSAFAVASASFDRLNRSISDGRRSKWDRGEGSGTLTFDWGSPSFAVRSEERVEGGSGTRDSLLQGSFRFLDLAPSFASRILPGWTALASVQVRSEDSSLAGQLHRSFDAITQGLSTNIVTGEELRATLDLQSRKVDFTDRFRLRGNQDSRTTLIRSTIRSELSDGGVRSDWLYEFSRQQSARFDRTFIRVQPGSGQFRYLGDLNGNGISEEQEFEQVRYDGDYMVLLIPGETFLPVSVVRASGRVRFRPDRLGVSGFLRRFSFESSARVEEKSTDANTLNLAYLRVGTFLNPATTLSGMQTLAQDVHFDESRPDLNVRVRVSERRGLTQLTTVTERLYGNERSFRFRGRIDAETVFQVDGFVRRDRLLGGEASTRTRDLVTSGGEADVAYRLDREWEVGMAFGASRATDIYPGQRASAHINEQSVRGVYGVAASGTVRAEIRREDVTIARSDLSGVGAFIPFELTDGRNVGISWLWNLHAEIQLTDLIQVSALYSARAESAHPVVHNARVEARAVF